MSDEETPLEGSEPEGSQGEPTEPEATLEDAAKAAVVDSTAPQVESQEFDWSQFKNADRFKGRGVQDVIDYLTGLEHKYGRQTNELGELRRYREQTEPFLRQAQGKPQEKKPTGFTEGQKYEFAQRFQDEPLGAVSEFMVPHLAEQLRPVLMEQVRQELGPTLQTQAQHVATQTEYEALVRNHPEIETDQELRWMTHQLLGAEYLGGNAPFEEAMFLAKLAKDEPSLFSTTCELMRRGIRFERARKYAELEQNAPASAETKKQQLKDEVKGLRRGSKVSSKGSKTSEPEIKDMDDVLDSVKNEFS